MTPQSGAITAKVSGALMPKGDSRKLSDVSYKFSSWSPAIRCCQNSYPLLIGMYVMPIQWIHIEYLFTFKHD
jgi:hypothetical protein